MERLTELLKDMQEGLQEQETPVMVTEVLPTMVLEAREELQALPEPAVKEVEVAADKMPAQVQEAQELLEALEVAEVRMLEAEVEEEVMAELEAADRDLVPVKTVLMVQVLRGATEAALVQAMVEAEEEALMDQLIFPKYTWVQAEELPEEVVVVEEGMAEASSLFLATVSLLTEASPQMERMGLPVTGLPEAEEEQVGLFKSKRRLLQHWVLL